MKQTHWLDSPFLKNIYKASSIHSSFKYYIDFWLIGKGEGYVDAKRIGPIMFVALFMVVAWFFLLIASEMEGFSHLLVSNTGSQSRTDFILWRLSSYINHGWYGEFIFGMFLSVVFFFLGLYFLFSPYPRPVRFSQKNGIVYTKFLGKIWVTDWDIAAIKMWRGTNYVFLIPMTHRGIALRMHSLDKNGHILERWVLLSGVNNNRINDLEIGGDPCLLYWHWLNDYMQGASFEGDPTTANKKIIPNPKIGRLWLLEKLMRFRDYKFSKSIDEQAIALDAKLKAEQLYPHVEGDVLPNNPFFTWQYHYPDRIMPNAKGEIIQPVKIITDPTERKALALEEKLVEQGFNNHYKHYHLSELEKVLVSGKLLSDDETRLIKLYIEMGGYRYGED